MPLKKYRRNRLLNKSKGKFVAIALIALLLIASAGTAYLLAKDNAASETTANEVEDEIDLSPPSEDELRATEENKKELSSDTDSNIGSSPSATKKVKPMITSSGIYEGSVEVGSRVPNVFESNGTCTLKLSKDGRTITKSREATQNVSEMSCGFITIPTSKLSSGNWSATVSYKSNKHSGKSDPVTIRVD